MTPIENSEKNKDKPLSDKIFKRAPAINYIAHNPAVTLAVGLIMGGVGTMYNPFKKGLAGGKRAKLLASNWFLAPFGLYVAVVTGLQLQNVKAAYRHAVSIELDKKSEDVTLFDLLHTKNTVIQDTRKQFEHKILGRISALLAPLLPSFLFDKTSPTPVMSGATALENAIEGYYTTVWDGLLSLSAIQRKPYDRITAGEIKNIMVMQGKSDYRKRKIPYLPPSPGTEEAKNGEILAGFIAHLLDEDREQYERYKKGAPQQPTGYFKLPTFVYLMGNEAEGTGESYLNQEFPINLAYVELAKQDDGRLNKVKEAAHALAKKEDPDSVFHRYGIDMNKLASDEEEKLHIKQVNPAANIQPSEHSNPTTAPSQLPQTQLSQVQHSQTLPHTSKLAI